MEAGSAGSDIQLGGHVNDARVLSWDGMVWRVDPAPRYAVISTCVGACPWGRLDDGTGEAGVPLPRVVPRCFSVSVT